METNNKHHKGFILDMLQNPEDETPRLIYADWLKDHDLWNTDHVLKLVLTYIKSDAVRLLYADCVSDNGNEEKADFIRLQIQLTRHQKNAGEEKNRLKNNLLRADDCQLEQWFQGQHEVEGHNNDQCLTCQTLDDMQLKFLEKSHLLFGELPVGSTAIPRRGFIAELSCSSTEWSRERLKVVAKQPLERVVLHDKEPAESNSTTGS